MGKTFVPPDKYIDLLNEELQRHPSYKKGMEFCRSSPDSNGVGMSGICWLGAEKQSHIFAEVVNIVADKYEPEFWRASDESRQK